MTAQAITLQDELLALESERARALMEEDHESIARLFGDELVYVHTTGLVQNKAQYQAYAREAVRYLAVERGALQVRVLAEGVALMTGPQVNLLQKRSGGEPIRAEGFVTQVWQRNPEGWQIVAFHGTRASA
ncbi:nuclear transport factor 2 family protein [Pseudomonas japonica]|uniref:nuclear transport factor 2 family protein n=1 Tax=Pseudomonas japonica TaxID=256466 RepID=UPI0015E3CABB|nr:nuclear transport factor 2 family protein [Pseudomonas japonica]MBA1289266.1 nuclear transport factor 2 family protein [Pseudomonas japonica]